MDFVIKGFIRIMQRNTATQMYTLTISNGSSQNTWLATHLINSQCKTIQCSYSATKSNFLQCSVFVGTVRWSVTRCLIRLETTLRRWYAVSKEKTGSATTFRQTVVLIRCSAGTSVPRRYLPNPYITTSLNYWSQDGSMSFTHESHGRNWLLSPGNVFQSSIV